MYAYTASAIEAMAFEFRTAHIVRKFAVVKRHEYMESNGVRKSCLCLT
jgi:hypothetical protein